MNNFIWGIAELKSGYFSLISLTHQNEMWIMFLKPKGMMNLFRYPKAPYTAVKQVASYRKGPQYINYDG